MTQFAGKTAVVTGAASGIGREIARQLAADGSFVLVTDLAGAPVDEVVAEIKRAEGNAAGMVVDVTKPADLQAAVDAVVAEHGRLDYMFSNAGVGIFGDLELISTAESDAIVDVNLRAVINGVTIAYQQMIKQSGGHIVTTASAAGLLPVPLQAHYCATKHAVIGLHKALALESGRHGVATTVFCPAWVESGMFDTSTLRGSLAGVDPREMVPVKPLATEIAVERLLRGVRRKRRMVITPAYARVGWWIERLSPALSHHLHRISAVGIRRRAEKARAR